jgi:mono/diheme cytochrome c family protein
MQWSLPPQASNDVLSALWTVQLLLRDALHSIGITALVHGQPEWPFAQRLAAEIFVFDPGYAKRVVVCAAAICLMPVLLLAALLWRKGRAWLLGAACVLPWCLPWPDANLLLTAAVPTSFHASTTGFTAHGIAQGQQVYQQHCLRCHGEDGRGEGPDAAKLPMWPPTLNGALLWQRLEGELFWRVREGLTDRKGHQTMPGFARQLTNEQTWAVLDFLQAQAAGQTLARSGVWERPVRMPDATVQCRQSAASRTLRSLQGQRLRVVMAQPGVPWPSDDPRWVTVHMDAEQGDSVPATDPDAECVARGGEAVLALSLVVGVPPVQLAGYQVMVDRGGWLRVRGTPGQSNWSSDDLLCRATPGAGPALPERAGMDGLVQRMDAEPVRFLRGGFPH